MWSGGLGQALSLPTLHRALQPWDRKGDPFLWSPSSFPGEEVTVRRGVSSQLCLC